MNVRSIIVIKIGGELLGDEPTLKKLAEDINGVTSGYRVVIVHGAGPQITEELKHRNIPPQFVDGQRVTDTATLKVVCSVLGEMNNLLVRYLIAERIPAVGMPGYAGGVISARQMHPELGFVGVPTKLNKGITKYLFGENSVPVIVPFGVTGEGQLLNINADGAAGFIASQIGAKTLVFLTGVPGVLSDPGNMRSLLKSIYLSEIGKLKRRGVISGGMIPKIDASRKALRSGVKSIFILDGRRRNVLQLALDGKRIYGTVVEK
jgi:acetylglutamate kinase